jgi:hypothetical protein
MVDVNMAITRSKVTKKHVFKDRDPLKRSLLLIGKRSKTTTIFCQNHIRNASRRPIAKFDSKGESTVEYKLGKIPRI